MLGNPLRPANVCCGHFEASKLLLSCRNSEDCLQSLSLPLPRVVDCRQRFQYMLTNDSALHSMRVNTSMLSLFSTELGFWVKPRPAVWFSEFVVHHFDERR